MRAIASCRVIAPEAFFSREIDDEDLRRHAENFSPLTNKA
jgi:hypothetical protein